MFVRKYKNQSGTTSIHIVDKSSGAYRIVKSFGSAHTEEEIERLMRKAQNELLPSSKNQERLFPITLPDDRAVENFLESISNSHIRTVGPELIFGTLFDRMGFNIVPSQLFRHITIARLAYPTSKLKTVDYLFRYQGVTITEDAIYKFLDSIYKKYKPLVEKVVFEHTKKTLGTITIVFYDMTTLYFEAEDEDDLRKIGYSKDGKRECPQIMLGLLVGANGYPIGYDMFEGNTFEGKTLIPTLEKLQQKYGFAKPIVVADAGLLSKNNIAELTKADYTFILGGRIKNESQPVQEEILVQSKDIKDQESFEIKKIDGARLIVTYSLKRAGKDAHNREKGLKKLRARVASGKLTKTQITNRGYNKFLSLAGDITVTINEEKVAYDRRWDGLKGYATNTKLTHKEIVEQYGHLWQIEKAFRISKTDLRIRPVFHYKRRRIESHLCIAFVAYAIWKELERLLQQNGLLMSARRAGELTHTMYKIRYTMPQSKETKDRILTMDDEQQSLYDVIHGK